MNPWRAAIDQALLLQKQPALANAFKQTALPDGMAILIRLASDEGERKKDLAQLLETDEAQLQAAATDYLVQICLFSGSSDLRTLGLNSGADLKSIKEHHRLLLKWLHPDRNPDNQALAERVNQAWATLKNATKVAVPTNHAFEGGDERGPPQSAGRFPLFLWGLAGLVVLLLALSLLPNAEIYVADAGSDEVGAADLGTATAGSAFEKKLSDLKLTFGQAKNTVLPAGKPDKPRTKKVAAKAPVVRAEALNSVTPKPNIKQGNTVAEPVLVDVKPAKQVSSKSVAPVKSENPAIAVVSAKPVLPEIPLASERNFQADGQALLAQFRQRYKLGDIGTFMQIFAETARNNRGDRQAIESDYARFFSNSSSRKISFSDEKWLFREGVSQFRAKYTANVRHKGELLPEISKGNIEMVMSEENGKLRIQQILLGN